ncbi:hypothetical protein [Frankia tisae]|uniref:hypothetical protein n=1 Tax=Frankia tisae TaxID=2950104 RepID=UPI0021C1D7BB|nr:hypothetical protein [Frankia tisae]
MAVDVEVDGATAGRSGEARRGEANDVLENYSRTVNIIQCDRYPKPAMIRNRSKY